MPELPEVETIRKELQNKVAGRRIAKVCVYNPSVIREPSSAAFQKKLRGLSIKKVMRRGKLLVFELSNGTFLTVHLKMTGQLVLSSEAKGGSALSKDSRVGFHLSGGKMLNFNDQRMFGELRLVDSLNNVRFIRNLGPEPFDLTAGRFKEMLSKKKTKIKPLLMDQSFLSGIGNLYAAEILFRSRINPWRQAQSLSEKEKNCLYKETKKVLSSAIKHGGSSIDDYVRLSGKPGDYVRFHRVYGRENKPCFVCKTPIERRNQSGRGTYFCPNCQR
ncbi:MAG: DNA-formamidopyrimidine glycosylase [Candidatus Omnitrophota bacterium]